MREAGSGSKSLRSEGVRDGSGVWSTAWVLCCAGFGEIIPPLR